MSYPCSYVSTTNTSTRYDLSMPFSPVISISISQKHKQQLR